MCCFYPISHTHAQIRGLNKVILSRVFILPTWKFEINHSFELVRQNELRIIQQDDHETDICYIQPTPKTITESAKLSRNTPYGLL